MSEYDVKAIFTADTSDLDGALKKTEDGVKGTEKAVEGTGGGLNAMVGKLKGVAAAAAGAFAVKKVVDFAKSSAEVSAELQAMEAQFDQVFQGDANSEALERISSVSGDTKIHVDRLTNAFNSFGAQTKGAGMDASQSLEATEKATRLAADSAAFYDTSLEDAQGSIASFMKGNFAAGDAIGVFTNAKQMDVRANETYGKSWADLSEAERQWLLLDTVEKTYEMNGAMGQAVRESGELANVQGNLTATWDRFKATVGEPILQYILIPAMQALMGVMEALLPIVSSVASWLGEKMAAVAPLLSEAWEGVKSTFMGLMDFLSTLLMPIFENLVSFIQTNMPGIQETFTTVFTTIQSVVGTAMEGIRTVIESILSGIQSFWETWGETIKTVATTLWDGIKVVITNTLEAIQNIIKAITSAIDGDWSGAWEAIKAAASNIVDGIKAIVETTFESMKTIVSSIMDKVKSAVSEKWEQLKSAVSDTVESMKSAIESKVEDIKSEISSKFESMKEKVSEIVENLKTAVTDAFGNIKEGVSDGLNAALDTVSGFFQGFKDAGANIVDMIAQGIENAVSAVTGAISNVTQAIRNFLPFSPAKEGALRDIHRLNFGGTISEAIKRGEKEVKKASGNLASVSRDAIDDALDPKLFENNLKGIVKHLLNTEKSFLEFYNTFGEGGEEMFERLRQGGNVAMTEVINLIDFMGVEGYDAAEIGKYMGDNWHDAMALIIDKYTEWDMANQQTVYSIEEMNAAFNAMVNVGRQGSQAVTADIENIGETAKRVAADNLNQINGMLSGMRAFAMANKESFIGAMEDMGMYGVDVWDNIAAGGKFADGVMASLVKRILSMEDQTKAMDIANRAFASHFRKDMAELMVQAGEWESSYNVGSWALDQNKLLALSLEQVEAAAQKVKESIASEQMAKPIKDDAMVKTKEDMLNSLEEIKTMTKTALDAVKEQFTLTFGDIKKVLMESFTAHIIPTLKDAFDAALKESGRFAQWIFDDFDHVFYELKDVVNVNMRQHVNPAIQQSLNQSLAIVDSFSQGMFNAGVNLMRALADGIRNGMVDVTNAMGSLNGNTVGVDWYAEGGIFNKPSVIGVGERGSEVVLPTNKLDSFLNRASDSARSQSGNAGGISLDLVLQMGNRAYRAQVEDMTNAQNRKVDIDLVFGE